MQSQEKQEQERGGSTTGQKPSGQPTDGGASFKSGAAANLKVMGTIVVGAALLSGVVYGAPITRAVCLLVIVLGASLVWQARKG